MFDVTTVAVIGLIGLMFYQIVMSDRQNKRYTEAIDNNTKAINAVREIMLHINSSDGMHEKLLNAILDKLNK
jgi:hypothetical protein